MTDTLLNGRLLRSTSRAETDINRETKMSFASYIAGTKSVIVTAILAPKPDCSYTSYFEYTAP